MRRGGRLILILGIFIAVAAALAFYVLTTTTTPPPEPLVDPTEIPKVKVVVARLDIPNNTLMTDTETFLTTRDILETQFNESGEYFKNREDLRNKLTLHDIAIGDPILRSDVTDAGLSQEIPTALPDQPRPKAFPFPAENLSGVADQIKPGDFVDVLVSFNIIQTIVVPSVNDEGEIVLKEKEVTNRSTKTLIQNVQVLRILKPAAPPPDVTPTVGAAAPAAEGPPTSDASGSAAEPTPDTTSFQPGTTWVIILALTDQQAEILKFSIEQRLTTGAIPAGVPSQDSVTLVLRGRGDTSIEQTVGATIDILISQFGLPLPLPLNGVGNATLPGTPTVSPLLVPTPTPQGV